MVFKIVFGKFRKFWCLKVKKIMQNAKVCMAVVSYK